MSGAGWPRARWVNGIGRLSEDVEHCRSLVVETQNINVPACRFYVHMGSVLRAINCMAYPDLPGEVQLLWCKEL